MNALSVLAAVALVATAAPLQINVERALHDGQSALASRDYENAKVAFDAVLKSDPNQPAAHLNLGIIALVENKPDVGLAHFSQLGDDVRALIGRLDCELRLHKVSDAQSTALRLERLTAQNSPGSAHIAKLLVAAGEFRSAIPFLRRIPGADGANLLGTAEEKTGNLKAAASAFAEAVRIEPANEDYRIDLGAALLNAGRVDDSVAAFRAAAKDFPNSSHIKLGLGSALFIAGTYREAAESILGAVRLQPDPRAYDLLGKVYESAGELQPQIRSEFEKYLSSSPADATAYTHYAAILIASAGDTVEARKALRRALQLQPDLAAAHLQLGILEQSAENWKQALQSYLRAAELDRQNATVHYRLGAVYSRLGNTEKARTELAEFKRLKAVEKTGSKAAP